MKIRYISLLLFAASISLLLCFACTKPPSAPLGKGEREFEENSRLNLNSTNVVRSGDILYFNTRLDDSTGTFLIAADLKTGEAMPVCGKPDCIHNSSECNAYLKIGEYQPIMAYNERIYWMERSQGKVYLYSMASDGADRNVVMELDDEFAKRLNGNNLSAIYDGKLYRVGMENAIEDGLAKKYTMAYYQPLEKNGKPVEIMRLDGGDSVLSRIHEHTLYCASFVYTFDEADEEIIATTLRLNAYDMDSGELKELYNGEVDFGALDFFVQGDRLIFHGFTVESYSLESGKFTTLFKEEEGNLNSYDATDDVLFAFTSAKDYVCKDFDGNIISEGIFVTKDLESECMKLSLGSIDGVFYYYMNSPPGVETVYNYLVSFDPKTSEIKLLWKGERGR